MKDFVQLAQNYAQNVCSGKQIVCSWVQLACSRFLGDIKRSNWDYELDKERATRFCRAMELMPHIKGEWKGTTIVLEPWQCFIMVNVFGWVHKKTKKRRFRTAYIEVPRKNSKSTMAAMVGNCMLALDDEPGAEIYTAATTRDQAKIVFNISQNQARRMPGFRKKYGVRVNAHSIDIMTNASKYEPLSAEGNTLDGLNIHCGIIDELHAHRNRNVYDVVESGMGSRIQPLLFLITTAGSDRAGVCYEQRSYLTKVLQNIHDFEDDSYFGVIYTTDDDDDWTDPAIWAKANPNYGISVKIEDLESRCKQAIAMVGKRNAFLTKRLNVWVNADTAWMDMVAWRKCEDATLKIEDFEGEECYIGLDLASRKDLAAKMILFYRSEHYYVFGSYYLPEKTIRESSNSQYQGWALQGILTETDGDTIDFNYIEDDLNLDKSRFQIAEIPYDPFQATQFATNMLKEGFPMVEYGATVRNFSEPMKELEALVLNGKFHHNADPILEWAMSNVIAHHDKKDNIFPNKEHANNKIDPVVATIMALGRAMVKYGSASVYETRGVVAL